MIGESGKTDGDIKRMLLMTLSGKKTDLNFLKKTVTDGGGFNDK